MSLPVEKLGCLNKISTFSPSIQGYFDETTDKSWDSDETKCKTWRN
jgi:hypothetical protein